MTKSDQLIFQALRQFAANVTAKVKALAAGEPEDQLRGPLENFLGAVGKAIGRKVIAKGESQLPGRLGRPDYAILAGKLLAGYVELKEPGKGANPDRYKGHDRKQWQRFQAVPNIIYCDGNEWGLYRDGKRVGRLVRLSGDITEEGKAAVKRNDFDAIKPLLMNFLSWEPSVAKDAKALAELLAPLCRMLRQEVNDALKDNNSALARTARDWRQLLFPEADDDRFADAYAQTVTFALLLARSEGARTVDLHAPIDKLAADHALLSRALQVLTDPKVQTEVAPSLRLLQRVIDRVPEDALTGDGSSDPWLYFYEVFLAAYDAKLRKDAGAYYTPVEVVQAQVRLIDRLLVDRLDKPMGFSEGGVIILDPAVGTGTYLLGVVDHAMKRIADEQGPGAVAGHASQLGRNIFGFEIMVGPYAVAQLRISRALLDRGASLPKDGPGVYLTDTLESPHAQPPQQVMGWAERELAEQHKKATKVKDAVPVLVCLGNPPYDRHQAADATDPGNLARTGGWVRYGDPLAEGMQRSSNAKGSKKKNARIRQRSPKAILKDREKHSILHKAFVQPAIRAGHGGDVKNLYNLYIYFWRWALWKVFEHTVATGPGVVSFISASSYLDGDAFVGIREHMRRLCDEIWIIDLGGEGRGTRKSENVFAIQTPVAIGIAVRYRQPQRDRPATVHYTCIEEDSRDEKLQKLEAISDFADLTWHTCPGEWHAPFRPAGRGKYFDWPLLIDLLPWQHSGVKVGRTWPIAPDEQSLRERWQKLCEALRDDRAALFVDRPTGRRAGGGSQRLPPGTGRDKPITEAASRAPLPPIQRYAYRSLDRHYLIADARLIDRPAPSFWRAHSDRQVYLTTLLNHPLGVGPALTACGYIPDLHYFRGSYGAREAIPLYRDSRSRHANVLPGLLDLLDETYGGNVSPEDLLGYVYGVLAQPAFTSRFEEELITRQLRLPLTKSGHLFEQVSKLGRRLLWLHTYGQRFTDRGRRKGQIPRGAARCTKAVSDKAEHYPDSFDYNSATERLTVGAGTFEPVKAGVYEFEVSGLKVVQSWLRYRMRSGKGKKSSPLDDIRPVRWTAQFTTELLELLHVLEATLAMYPQQCELLDAVLAGPLFKADELPRVPDAARRPLADKEGMLWQEDS